MTPSFKSLQAQLFVCLFVCLCLEDAECGVGRELMGGWVGGWMLFCCYRYRLFVCVFKCLLFCLFGVVVFCRCFFLISKLIFCLHPETS